jgi:glycosyltransferase involved in cell wall biosynthesis
MRWIVFAYNLPPINNPRAKRISKMRTLVNNKIETLYFTRRVKDHAYENWDIIPCGHAIAAAQTTRNKLKKYAFIRFIHRLFWPDDFIFYQIVCLFKYIFNYSNPADKILTVSNPFSSHLIGLLIKKFTGRIWIADIGDTFYNEQRPSLINKLFEKIILNAADQIIVNSESLNQHFQKLYTIPPEKIVVIPNGITIIHSDILKTSTNQIRLSYIGNTYAEVREGLEELKILLQLPISYQESNYNIRLYGKQSYKLTQLAKYKSNVIHLAYCKNDKELIEAYSQTDILILFANQNNPGLPSKIEEYLATGIPIINFYHSESDASFRFLKLHGENQILHVLIEDPNLNEIHNFISAFRNFRQSKIIQTDNELAASWMNVLNNAKSAER